MVDPRRKDPGRKGRPAARGGKTRRSRSTAGRSAGSAKGRARGRRMEGAGPRPRRLRRVRGLPPEATQDQEPPRHGRKGWVLQGLGRKRDGR